tara:strand:- start:195 stop:1220 length:1026 start_codon:yes stop_codon:yes gene_type:complete
MDPDLYFPVLAAAKNLKPLSYMLFALGAVPLLLCIGCLVAYLRAKLTPTTPINEIKEGSAEVKGTVKAIGPLLKSPISHQDCVLYAVIFHGGGGMSRHDTTTKGPSTLFWEIQSTPYVIDDGTGVAELDGTELVMKQRDHSGLQITFGPDINKYVHRGSVPPDISEELSAKLGDDVRRKFDGTLMGLSRIEEYHLKPGEEVYFLGKVEDNSKPVEPHWLMKERSLTESKPDPKKEHSDQIHIQRGDDESGPFTLEQVNAYLDDGTFLLTDKATNEHLTEFIPIHQIPGVKVNTGAKWRLRGGTFSNKSEEAGQKKRKMIALISLLIAMFFLIPAILILVLT